MKSEYVIILGANSDMAKAIADDFAQKGYNLILASRDTENLEREAADLNIRYNVNVKSVYFDASDFNSHSAFRESLDVEIVGVVLAFGVMFPQDKSEKNLVMARNMINTNYLGAVNILETFAPYFEEKEKGFIVGISSVAGERGRQSNYLYGSSKAAFTTYLQGLRHRMSKHNVLVITVKPGFVKTKMTAHLELPGLLTAEPAEVSKAVLSAIRKKKHIVYVKSSWRYIMLVIKSIPSFIFHKTDL